MTEVEGNAPKRRVVAIRAGMARVVAEADVVLSAAPTTDGRVADEAANKVVGKAGIEAVARGNGTTAPAEVDKTAASVAKVANVGRQRAAARAVVEVGAMDADRHPSPRSRWIRTTRASPR